MSRRASGEGTLYFDEGRGRWIGQAEAGINPRTGRRRRVKVTGRPGEGKRAVSARLRERVDHLEATSTGAPATVGELVDSWLTRAAPKRMSERTMAMVDSMVRHHLDPVLGSVRIHALTVEDVERWLEAKADTMAKSSLIKLRSYLAQAYDFGLRRRHVTWNPARAAELPVSAESNRVGRALTSPEVRALLNVAARHRLGAWVTVAVTLGLRPGEVSGMTWEAIGDDTVTIFQAMGWTRGQPALKATKTGNARTLSLPAPTLEALRRHRAAQVGERLLLGDQWPTKWGGLVFITTAGTPLDPSNVRRLVSQLAAEAGIKGNVAPYDLRHTATSLMSAGGHAPELLADLLGHKDTRMLFKHYRHRVTASVTVAADFWNATTA